MSMDWSSLEVLVTRIIIQFLNIFIYTHVSFSSNGKLYEAKDSSLFSSTNIVLNNVKLLSLYQRVEGMEFDRLPSQHKH